MRRRSPRRLLKSPGRELRSKQATGATRRSGRRNSSPEGEPRGEQEADEGSYDEELVGLDAPRGAWPSSSSSGAPPPGGGGGADAEESDEGSDDDEPVGLDALGGARPSSSGGAAPPPGRGGSAEAEASMQRKLLLFGCGSVQASIGRMWSMLPRNENGELTMNGYVECHLRFQKSLTKEFEIQRALASAIEDWEEDVPAGQKGMNGDEFSMFLFELCSLWCGPRICLQLYLLFLNAIFIAVTEARGSHTIGLKPIEAIERLPKAFFDLLSTQGWVRPSRSRGEDDEEDESLWHAKNLAPESQRLALEQAQRQVFQVTHDARAVVIFERPEDRGPPAALAVVRHAAADLAKISQAGPLQAAMAISQPRPQPPDVTALAVPSMPAAGRAEAAVAERRRQRSAPGRTLASAKPRLEAVPVGRSFDTRRAENRARGLVLAPSPAVPAGGLAGSTLAKAGGFVMSATTGPASGAAAATEQSAPWPPETFDPAKPSALALAGGAKSANLLDAVTLLPTYKLPLVPADVYQKQVEPLMRSTPAALVFKTGRAQDSREQAREPFERVLRKLPEAVRPVGPGAEPGGPFGHPTEPLWSEMTHRLQNILRKQGRRAERRRKRRQRARQGGMRLAPGKPNAGRELREYLDQHAMAMNDPTGEASSEFIEKVREWQQLHQEKQGENHGRWKIPLVADCFGDGSFIRRPVYVPPPNEEA